MASIIRVPSRCRQATNSSSLVPRYAYTMGLEMPASSAISSMLAAWKPRREKTLTAASSICCSRTARGRRLKAGTVDTLRAYLLVRKVTHE